MDDWVSLLETHILIIDSLPFIPLIYRSISTINEIIFTLSNSNDNYYCVTMCMHAKFCIWLQRGRGSYWWPVQASKRLACNISEREKEDWEKI